MTEPYFTIYSCGTTVSANRVGDIGRAMLVQYAPNQENSLVLHGVGSRDTSEVINGERIIHNTPGTSELAEDGRIKGHKRFTRIAGTTQEISGYVLGTGEDENIERAMRAINTRLHVLQQESNFARLTVNLVGFSRGAKQNIKLANAAYIFALSNYCAEEVNPVVLAMNVSSHELLDRQDIKIRLTVTLNTWKDSSLIDLKRRIDALPDADPIRLCAYDLLCEMMRDHHKLQTQLAVLSKPTQRVRCEERMTALTHLAAQTARLLEHFLPNAVPPDSFDSCLAAFRKAAQINTLEHHVKSAATNLLLGVLACVAGVVGSLICSVAYIKRCICEPDVPSLFGFLGTAGLGFYDYFVTAWHLGNKTFLNQERVHASKLEGLVTPGFSFFEPQANLEANLDPRTYHLEWSHIGL